MLTLLLSLAWSEHGDPAIQEQIAGLVEANAIRSELAPSGPQSYPEISAYWSVKPTLKVCETSSISRSRVKRAVSYWVGLGYEFEDVVFDDESLSCTADPSPGEIVITTPDQDFDFSRLAITKTYRIADTGTIVYSTIQLPPENQTKERVLEHEIGHALGWDHTVRPKHMMNENWVQGGADSTGTRHRRYTELSEALIGE